MASETWIFGYGSLIWDPGFVPAEIRRAELAGWRRSFCMRSICFRGTPAAPGLVLALDAAPDARCAGLALRLPDEGGDAILAAIRARELVTNAYLERRLAVTCEAGTRIEAIAYVIDPDGPQYCRLDEEEQARIIAVAAGERGPNRDYLWNTARHLDRLGLADPALARIGERVRELASGGLAPAALPHIVAPDNKR